MALSSRHRLRSQLGSAFCVGCDYHKRLLTHDIIIIIICCLDAICLTRWDSIPVLVTTCCMLPNIRSQCSTHPHFLHLRYQNQEDTPKGPLMLEHQSYLSASGSCWSLVRALTGVLTPNMPDLVDQKKKKKKRPSFFSYVCFFNERSWCIA